MNQHMQAEAAGPNPLYIEQEPKRLNSIHELALEYVHDLRRANDHLGRLAFRRDDPNEKLLAQLAAVRAKNTELEARNRELTQKHPWDMDVPPAPGNPLGSPANTYIADLRASRDDLGRERDELQRLLDVIREHGLVPGPLDHLQAQGQNAPYYKPPQGQIDGDKTIREARAKLDAFNKAVRDGVTG